MIFFYTIERGDSSSNITLHLLPSALSKISHFLATSCRNSFTMHLQSSTCLEVDECDIDTEHLLSNEKKREKYQRQQKRNSALLVGNVFVLLLNMGLFLTASIRKAMHVTECTQSVRLPHSGQSVRPNPRHSRLPA